MTSRTFPCPRRVDSRQTRSPFRVHPSNRFKSFSVCKGYQGKTSFSLNFLDRQRYKWTYVSSHPTSIPGHRTPVPDRGGSTGVLSDT